MIHFYRAAGRRLLPLFLLALLSLSAAAQGQLARYRTGKTQLDQGHAGA